MKQAILITNDICTLEQFAEKLLKFFKYYYINSSQLNLVFDENQSEKNYLSITFFDEIYSFLDPIDKNKIDTLYPYNKHYFVVDFREFSTFKFFISQFYQHNNFIIYNDFGHFYNHEEIKAINTYQEFISIDIK